MRSLRRARAALVLALAFAPACLVVGGENATFTLVNESSYDLIELNLSPVDAWSWGPNLLGREPLYPGESITIDFIACDYYDVRVVDETYTECFLFDLDLCFSDDVWIIHNSLLRTCAFYG